MPARSGSTPTASPRRRCARSSPRSALARRRRSPRRSNARIRRQGRGAVRRTGPCPGEPLAGGLEAALDEAIARAADPQGDELPARRRHCNDVKFVRPAHRLLALHGADVVPVTALGLPPAASPAATASWAARDIAIATPTPTTRRSSRRQRDRRPSPRAARRSSPASSARPAQARPRRSCPTRCSTRSPRWSSGRRSTPAVRARVPAGAAGMPDPDDAAEPEVLRAGRRRRQAAHALPDRVATSRPPTPPRSSTATSACCARGWPTPSSSSTRTAGRGSTRACRSSRRVVYHNKLGTQARARRARLRALAGAIAALLGADAAHADRAALLAKADLVTDMVGEFPELQGIMGRYYAAHDGEPPAVAAAIEQHYWPRFAGDALPDGPVAQAVALADKLETLAGMFGIGSAPTGDKDPFGLRRAALGVIRILIERRLPLPLAGRSSPRRSARSTACRRSSRARRRSRTSSTSACAATCASTGYTAQPGRGRASTQRPARLDLVPARLEAVRAFARCPRRPRWPPPTSASSTSCASPAARRRPRSTARCSPKAPSTPCYLAFQQLGPQVDARFARGRLRRRAARAGDARSRSSTASSTR